MHLTVGEVIRWDDFPYPKSGEQKARWFIYLGRSTTLSFPVFAYLCTTTTQLQHFERGGSRSNHACKRFSVKMFPQFEEDCILDFDEDLHDVTMEIINQHERQITSRGKLDENALRNIFNQYSRSGVVSFIALRDIYDSYNRAGITGLKKPMRK